MPDTDLLHSSFLILDGGLGTTLEDTRGVRFSQDTPLWSSHLLISNPETLQQVQQEFSEAGADIVLTPTYQASYAGFRKTVPGITDEEIVQYLRSAVNVSRSVSPGLVALSLGAYGAILQPSQEYSGEYGDMNEDELVAFHRERISAFDLSKVDVIAFETLPRLDEIRAVKQVVDGSKPYWISCVFPNDNKLPDGSTIEEVLATMMAEPRPWAIGVNCTKIEKILDLVSEFEAVGKRLNLTLPRLVIYPDGTNGRVYDTTKQVWVGKDNDDSPWHKKMGDIVDKIRFRSQVWEGLICGGCCKTTPKQIKMLNQRLKDGS